MWFPLIYWHPCMQTSTSQKSRTVSSWLLIGMWIKQKRSQLWAPYCNVLWRWEQVRALPPPHKRLWNKREFTQRRRRRQRERQKRNRFRQAKQQLCTCITLFCTFLCCRCTTTTWNCLISRFVEDGEQKTTTFFFFSWTLMQSFRFQLQKNFGNIRRIKRDGISAIKFEAAQIQFLSDVFVAVAIVVAWNKQACKLLVKLSKSLCQLNCHTWVAFFKF